ncbi:MAG: peptidylprolyl isomerase [Candidatus Cloacimonadaceae bacterium]|nr:peptidylprolyl isomerase [Candidatus Cloacimonadaceae bacterium]MDP3114326.1 peptidylprolyl isomerase [Candidatus Cloacimonadaceae bacterium]
MKRFLLILLALGALLYAQKPDSKVVVGKIADKTYTYGDYDNILKNYLDYHAKGKKLSAEEKAKLNEQCWEELIGRYIYDAAIKAGKIKLSETELMSEAKKNPPAGIKQIKDLTTNGNFDQKKYESALTDNAEFRKNVIAAVRETYQYTKLLNTLRAEVNVVSDSIKADWLKQSDTIDAQIIFFDYNKLTYINASEADAQQFYSERREDYRRENGRRFFYVHFPKAPSAADSLSAKQKVDEIISKLRDQADFGSMAQQWSQDPGSSQNGGELGFFRRGQMVPEFEHAAFSTPDGEIAEPVLTRFGWHIIQTLERRSGEQGEEVSARHILLRIEAGEKTLQKLKLDSSELYTNARETGLDRAAKHLNLQLRQTPVFFSTDGFIRDIGNEPKLVSYAFSNPVGSLADVHYAANGDVYILEVSAELPEYYLPFEEEKAAITNRATTTKRMYTMNNYIEDFMRSNSPNTYLQAAQRDTIMVVEVSSLKRDDNITSIGKVPALNEALFILESGGFTSLIEDNRRWFIGHVLKRNKPDLKLWEKQKNEIISKARKEKQQKHLNDWYFAERKKLSIIDNRADFYDLSAARKVQQIKL